MFVIWKNPPIKSPDGGQEMTAPEYEYDAFIAHSSKDDTFLSSLYDRLTGEEGIKVLNPNVDFISGVGVSENIVKAVEKCRRVILLLSKNYLKSKWFVFETMLAIKKGIMHKKQLLIPVLLDLEEKDIPIQLLDINYIKYEGDFENPGANEVFIERVLKALKAPDVPMTGKLPAGNIAHGLAWSYYYGYLRLILPGLKERVQRSQFWKADINERHILPKLFILLPNSCFCSSSLGDNDGKIVAEGPLEEFKANRSGNIARSYRNFVYKTKDDNEEEYHFIAEYATPLLSMYEMMKGNIAGLTQEECMYQKQLFQRVLTDVLTHELSEDCKGAFQLIAYEDKMPDGSHKYPISKLIVKTIKEGLAAEKAAERRGQKAGTEGMAALNVADDQ